MEQMIAVARVSKLFGQADTGGLAIALYTTFPDDFNPEEDPLFVEIGSLQVPLYFESFERRGVSGANVRFADFDNTRRAEELIGKELFIQPEAEEADDEFYMEDLIGFSVVAMTSEGNEQLEGEITDFYDSELNPLFGVDFGDGERLIPAAEEFIAQIDFDAEQIRMILPDGLLEL